MEHTTLLAGVFPQEWHTCGESRHGDIAPRLPRPVYSAPTRASDVVGECCETTITVLSINSRLCCRNGHDFAIVSQQDSNDSRYELGWFCDNCRRSATSFAEKRHSCTTCCEDLCFDCAPPNSQRKHVDGCWSEFELTRQIEANFDQQSHTPSFRTIIDKCVPEFETPARVYQYKTPSVCFDGSASSSGGSSASSNGDRTSTMEHFSGEGASRPGTFRVASWNSNAYGVFESGNHACNGAGTLSRFAEDAGSQAIGHEICMFAAETAQLWQQDNFLYVLNTPMEVWDPASDGRVEIGDRVSVAGPDGRVLCCGTVRGFRASAIALKDEVARSGAPTTSGSGAPVRAQPMLGNRDGTSSIPKDGSGLPCHHMAIVVLDWCLAEGQSATLTTPVHNLTPLAATKLWSRCFKFASRELAVHAAQALGQASDDHVIADGSTSLATSSCAYSESVIRTAQLYEIWLQIGSKRWVLAQADSPAPYRQLSFAPTGRTLQHVAALWCGPAVCDPGARLRVCEIEHRDFRNRIVALYHAALSLTSKFSLAVTVLAQ